MIFEPAKISGLIVLRLERHEDERGSFCRLFSRDEFAAHGLPADFVQQSLSVTRRRGTVRGMHFQRSPYAEVKFVRCVRGAIFDVVVDLRPASPTYLCWQGFRLDAEGDLALVIPRDCAHGFQTLQDHCEVLYQMDRGYHADSAGGIRFDDPSIGIEWPLAVSVIAAKDLGWPALSARLRLTL
jgi:dTDP-4-dehydrorhamnose 3,5-epimerase